MLKTVSTKSARAIKPSRNPLFIWRKVGTEAILFNPNNNETYMLNPTAAAIWEMCDGMHSVEDIADAIAGKFEAERAEILQDIEEFIAEGERDGYIESE